MSWQDDMEAEAAEARAQTLQAQRKASPVIPVGSVAGNALVAVVAIMTFLAGIALGAVNLTLATAAEWQSDIAREVTIQIRPTAGRDIEADVRRAVGIAQAAAGVEDVRPYSPGEAERLLEPWLGTGVKLTDLPVPRLIGVRLAGDGLADIGALRRLIGQQIPAASLDDHRAWSARLSGIASTVVGIGMALALLVLSATGLCVAFATRSAIANNRPIVEVLHFVGAKDTFIASQFQRHFLWLGLKGALAGGTAAAALFVVLSLVSAGVRVGEGGEEMQALFGSFELPRSGYLWIAGLVLVVALLTALTSRATVRHTLRSID